MSSAPTLPGFDYAPFLIPQPNGTSFKLWEEVTYTAKLGDSWDIPEGFVTDFATIPAIVSWAVPKLGAYTVAAIVHDLLCTGLNEWYEAAKEIGDEYAQHAVDLGEPLRYKGRLIHFPTADAVDTDAIFRRIALDLGTDRVTARLLWVGVRWGALFNPARRGGWWKRTGLKVLFWSAVYSPVLVPATVLAAVGRGVLATVRWLGRKA